MNYDYIFIGASLSSLLTATTIKNKSILIIEKDKYIGGAWGVNSNYYKNMDIVGHLIVPTNNIIGNKILEYFKNIDLELEYIDKKDFLFETESYRSNNKQGTPIIAKNGWTDFYNKIVRYVNKFNNIKIIINTEVLKINYKENTVILNCKNDNYICNKLIIPMYCNINKIYYHNTIIDIPYKSIINKHVLIEVTFNKSLKITKNYQAFLDKTPIGIFDRVTVSKIYNNNCILSCRISKNFKNKKNIEKLFLPFLKEKKILNDFCKITKISYYNYNCSYRNAEKDRNILLNISKKFKKIYILNTIYMGHFLENLIENKLFF
tara:strand:- start:293 stop:1252 length:960 start_codon:yes stop_codon:yes gene_type:complete